MRLTRRFASLHSWNKEKSLVKQQRLTTIVQTIKLRTDRSAGSLQLFLLMKSVIHEAQFSIFLAVDDDIASADRFASSSRRMQRNLTAANCQEFGNFVSLRCGGKSGNSASGWNQNPIYGLISTQFPLINLIIVCCRLSIWCVPRSIRCSDRTVWTFKCWT